MTSIITEYTLRAATLRELTHLSRRTGDELRLYSPGVTRQDVLDALHERALYAYHASTQGLDELVVVISHGFRGDLAQFGDIKLARALGVILDQADEIDWNGDLAELGLTRQGVLDTLRELALRHA